MDSQDSSQPRFGGSHHLPSYSIFCASPRGPQPNGILSRDSQMGVSKLLKLGFSRFWSPIILCADLQLRWGLKQSCSLRRELSNNMLHATCMQGNRVDSWLLVVGSQTTNLITGPSFGHNLCFKCSIRSPEPILDIYVSIDFQWYKKLFNPLDFDSCNGSLSIQESTRTPTPKGGQKPLFWIVLKQVAMKTPFKSKIIWKRLTFGTFSELETISSKSSTCRG